MATISASRPGGLQQAGADLDAARPAVAWGPIIGGAFAAAAVALILMALGTGLGLTAVSPWPNAGASAEAFGIATGVWLIIVHWFASGFGGYLTGRLRRKWAGLHSHEVFFRDTAHGFLTWAVATVIATAAFASLSAGLAGGGAKATSAIATATGAGQTDPVSYFVDLLYRPAGKADLNSADPALRAETARVLAVDLRNGSIPATDRAYLAQLVAARTGLSQADAQQRVDGVIVQARQATDAARKAAAAISLFTALALVIGAFIAAVAGALGGSHRDEWSRTLAMMRPEAAD
jgi:hypothetical protein